MVATYMRYIMPYPYLKHNYQYNIYMPTRLSKNGCFFNKNGGLGQIIGGKIRFNGCQKGHTCRQGTRPICSPIIRMTIQVLMLDLGRARKFTTKSTNGIPDFFVFFVFFVVQNDMSAGMWAAAAWIFQIFSVRTNLPCGRGWQTNEQLLTAA